MNRGGDVARPDRRAAPQLQAARYHDDDRSCDYECMAAESLDRALTSHFGGQAFHGRAAEITVEWECPTPELLAARDPAVVELLTDPALPLPRVMPDGEYRPPSRGR